MALLAASRLQTPARLRGSASRSSVRVSAVFSKATTKTELAAKGGRVVVDVGGQQVLVQSVGDEIFAVSNKCSHLGISLQGKTPLLSAKIADKCIVCPAHNTAFDLATGAVKGEWCPGFPDLPFVGKLKGPAPLPVFQVQVEGDVVSVAV